MDATKYEMAIVEGIQGALKNYFQTSSEAAAFHQDHAAPDRAISLNIGFTGEIEGEMIMRFSDDVVLKLVGMMMGGMEIQELDDMGRSACSEVGNWLGASCCNELEKLPCQASITPPVLTEDAASHDETAQPKQVLKTDIGEFNIYMQLKQAS